MENGFFQQARTMMMQMMQTDSQMSDTDKDSVNHALQAAYAQATPEEKQELQQLEQELRANNQL